jgi:hypothetical protein
MRGPAGDMMMMMVYPVKRVGARQDDVDVVVVVVS